MQYNFQVRFPFQGFKPGDLVPFEKVEEQFRSHNYGVKVVAENKGASHGATKTTNGQKATPKLTPASPDESTLKE